MAITISTDYLCALAMLKTTPLIVTVGLSLTIPFAVVVDVLRKTAIHGTVVATSVDQSKLACFLLTEAANPNLFLQICDASVNNKYLISNQSADHWLMYH